MPNGTNLLNNYFLAAFGLGYNGLNLGYNYASGVASNAIPVISGTTTTAVTGTGIGTISGNTATYSGQTLVNHYGAATGNGYCPMGVNINGQCWG
ncbi:unnamed protein product [Enterobius vermicularis]|uniref:Chlorovirus glycoprotein repeat domain-containing protein n=1 Tax=Enterobius vermicularis TaxID=51028 RepID=A0A0N4VRA1_ENTVE|nr:unnamed protein product [Enterobius vermicularis]